MTSIATSGGHLGGRAHRAWPSLPCHRLGCV